MATKPLNTTERCILGASVAAISFTVVAVALNEAAWNITIERIKNMLVDDFIGYIILGAMIALLLSIFRVPVGAVVAAMFLPLTKVISTFAAPLLCGFVAYLQRNATSGMWEWLSATFAWATFFILMANLALFYRRT